MVILEDRALCCSVLNFDKVDSTSDEAKRLITSGEASDRQVVVSAEQGGGRGRYGRTWESPKGNLYASLLLNLNDDLQKAAQYSFITAVALGEVISNQLPATRKIGYKWPNDILVDGKKISGILLESVVLSDSDNWLVIGLGVNISVTPKVLNRPVTSLKDCGVDNIAASDFLDKFIQTFETQEKMWQTKGFSYIRGCWLNKAYKLGEEIQVNLGNEVVLGRFEGISSCGELEIIVGGESRLIAGGEVFFSNN